MSATTNQKEALFVSGDLECNDPTKKTTIARDLIVRVASQQLY